MIKAFPDKYPKYAINCKWVFLFAGPAASCPITGYLVKRTRDVNFLPAAARGQPLVLPEVYF
jgi:hypothetical protein